MIAGFWRLFDELPGPARLLECGSRRQPGQPPGQGAAARLRRPDVPVWGLDCEPGEGVDVVADLHDLAGKIEGGFAAVLICSTLEHVRRPWVVAQQLARVCRPGAILYCATHQTFPLHGYPRDYFRFSADALREVFAADHGWLCLEAGHEFPCAVVPRGNHLPHARDWNFEAEAYLNSWCLARRT